MRVTDTGTMRILMLNKGMSKSSQLFYEHKVLANAVDLFLSDHLLLL
jgi:hypothetical protein